MKITEIDHSGLQVGRDIRGERLRMERTIEKLLQVTQQDTGLGQCTSVQGEEETDLKHRASDYKPSVLPGGNISDLQV